LEEDLYSIEKSAASYLINIRGYLTQLTVSMHISGLSLKKLSPYIHRFFKSLKTQQ